MEGAAVRKQRHLELVALADAIEVLNEDDALELLGKTRLGGLVQYQVTAESMRVRALSLVQISGPSSTVIEPAEVGGGGASDVLQVGRIRPADSRVRKIGSILA